MSCKYCGAQLSDSREFCNYWCKADYEAPSPDDMREFDQHKECYDNETR